MRPWLRALPPKFRSTTTASWHLSDRTIDRAEDSSSSADHLASFGSVQPPAIGVDLTGHVREFYGSEALRGTVGDASMRTAVLGDWTLQVAVRRRLETSPTFPQTIIAYGGDGTSGAGDNILFELRMTSSDELEIRTQSGANVDEVDTTSVDDFLFPHEEWVHIAIVKLDTANDPDYAIYVNGEQVDAITNATQPDGGTSAAWYLGAIESGAGVTQEWFGDIAFAHFDASVLTEDEIEEDFRRIRGGRHYTTVWDRLEVEDGTGARRDLTDLEGIDWVASGMIEENQDNPAATAEFRLHRAIGKLTLANLKTESKFNLTDIAVPGSYSPLIFRDRDLELFVARTPVGTRAYLDEYRSRLLGGIDVVNPAGDKLVIRARNLMR